MISLRRHIETYRDSLTESSLGAFRSALLAMARCGQRAVPGVSTDLNDKMARIQQSLGESLTPGLVETASRQADTELTEWAEEAYRHHEENEREIREMIGAVAKAAESVSDRDARYARELGEVAARLRTAAGKDDLSALRRSVIESTRSLKECMERMAEDGRNSVLNLTRQVDDYRARLQVAERNSSIDVLTELANRRAFERHLALRTSGSDPFCLILIDMNDFKGVNDHHGHMAGDDLLRQFAGELRAQFTAADLVARWGGDEFAVISPGDLDQGRQRVDRIRRWALGDYRIRAAGTACTVAVDAAIGVVEWDRRESGEELLARADKAVYAAKESAGAKV